MSPSARSAIRSSAHWRSPSVRFYGDVTIGSDLSIAELRESVDAVIYAYGAGSDRRLEIPGEQLPGSIAAAELVAWYCGHPDVHPDTDQPSVSDHLVAAEIDELISTSRHAVVVGVGNVALDVARMLIKTVDQLDDTDMADEGTGISVSQEHHRRSRARPPWARVHGLHHQGAS